jgi:Domain of unknown function (DUF1918)
MVEVGDRVLVESEKVGSVTRSGVVTAVEDRLITVRWDSGSESVFVPGAGSLRVTGHEPPAGEADALVPPGWMRKAREQRPGAAADAGARAHLAGPRRISTAEPCSFAIG